MTGEFPEKMGVESQQGDVRKVEQMVEARQRSEEVRPGSGGDGCPGARAAEPPIAVIDQKQGQRDQMPPRQLQRKRREFVDALARLPIFKANAMMILVESNRPAGVSDGYSSDVDQEQRVVGLLQTGVTGSLRSGHNQEPSLAERAGQNQRPGIVLD